jgi:hypothetical protein
MSRLLVHIGTGPENPTRAALTDRALLIIRRRRPIGEPATSAGPDRPALAAGVATYDGVAGAGRIVQALAELGITMDPCHQLVVDTDGPMAALGDVDLGTTFDLVVLGSHLVNLPDADARATFLALARRHLAPGGTVFVEHHPLDWAETAAEVRATPGGSSLGMVDVRRDPPFVSAVSVYDVGGRVVRQPFTARVLSEAELGAALSAAGFAAARRHSPTWLAAQEPPPHG